MSLDSEPIIAVGRPALKSVIRNQLAAIRPTAGNQRT